MPLTAHDLTRLRDILHEAGIANNYITEITNSGSHLTVLHRYSVKGDLAPAMDALLKAGYWVTKGQNPDEYRELMLTVTPPAPTQSTAQVDAILPTEPAPIHEPGCGCNAHTNEAPGRPQSPRPLWW